MTEVLLNADQELFLYLNGLYVNPFWDNFMSLYSGKLTWAPMYAVILYVLYRNLSLWACILSVVAIVLTITFADQICATFIRPWVGRMRPSNPANSIKEFVYIVNGRRGGQYGFPSCHAANSFGLAFFIMFLIRNRTLTYCILIWAALNCFSRIYLGVHYPGDLLAGAFIGFLGASIFYFTYRMCLYNPILVKILKITDDDVERAQKRVPFNHSRYIIFTAILTVCSFSTYSLIVTA